MSDAEYHRRYYRDNRETILAQNKEYRKKHREHLKRYYQQRRIEEYEQKNDRYWGDIADKGWRDAYASLKKRLPDEKTAIAYLEKKRWRHDVTCPRCGSDKCNRNVNRKRDRVREGFLCKNKECKNHFFWVTQETMLHGSNIETHIVLYAMKLYAYGMGAKDMMKQLSLGSTTVSKMRGKFSDFISMTTDDSVMYGEFLFKDNRESRRQQQFSHLEYGGW